MKAPKQVKQDVSDVMLHAKCDEATAKQAMKATKGMHWSMSVLHAKELVAVASIPKDNNDLTAEQLAKLWS